MSLKSMNNRGRWTAASAAGLVLLSALFGSRPTALGHVPAAGPEAGPVEPSERSPWPYVIESPEAKVSV